MTKASAPAAPVRDLKHLGDYTVRSRMLFITALAVPVGAVSACVAWALIRLIGLITNAIFYERFDAQLVLPSGGHSNPLIIFFAPVVGGLIVGLIARYGSEQIRGHGIPEAIESILLGGSKVAPRVSVLKPIASAVTIGTGGPFGAEGPIIMTGGAFGSLFAQFLRLTADERKTLLVAGSVAGMAATFNTPFSGIMLAVELLLFEWRPRSYVPVAMAVCVATVVRYPLLGSGALFKVPLTALHLTPLDFLLCVPLGLAAGLLAVVATRLVYFAEDHYAKLRIGKVRIHWMWWPAIGGVIIGIGGLIVPQALGVGYKIIGAELDGSISFKLIIGILIVKTLIWSLSLGSGTSGGILAPMFMVGGALGALAAFVFPTVSPGFWALVALAGVLGGVMRSPFTGVIFALELTHRFDALLPLVIGASAAFAISALILKRSVLTEKIARHGFHLTREYDVDPLEVLFIGEVMEPDVLTFEAALPVRDALHTISGHDPAQVAFRRQMLYPVLGDDDRMIGVVTRTQLESSDFAGRDRVTVGEISLRDPVVAHVNETLHAVATRMAGHSIDRMPVVADDDPGRLVGMVSVTMLLAGRLKDLKEARVSQRILHLHVVRTRGNAPRARPAAVSAPTSDVHHSAIRYAVGSAQAGITRASEVPVGDDGPPLG